jgi:hypothetical protein
MKRCLICHKIIWFWEWIVMDTLFNNPNHHYKCVYHTKLRREGGK